MSCDIIEHIALLLDVRDFFFPIKMSCDLLEKYSFASLDRKDFFNISNYNMSCDILEDESLFHLT